MLSRRNFLAFQFNPILPSAGQALETRAAGSSIAAASDAPTASSAIFGSGCDCRALRGGRREGEAVCLLHPLAAAPRNRRQRLAEALLRGCAPALGARDF